MQIVVDILNLGGAAPDACGLLTSGGTVTHISGGFYVIPTLQGARNGANIAQAWATVMHIGADGYAAAARELHRLTERMKRAVQGIDGLALLCDSDAAIVPFVCKPMKAAGHAQVTVDLAALAAQMAKRGWNLFTSRNPKCISVCISEQHLRMLDTFIGDLSVSVEACAAAAGSAQHAEKGGGKKISGPYSAGGEGGGAPMTKEQEQQLRAKMDERLRDYIDSSFEVSRL